MLTILEFLSPMALVWLIALVVFAVAEAATVALVSVWFCGGAVVALIAAGLNAPVWVQILLFLAVSGLLLALVAPWARRASRANPTATNADRHIGRTALVTEDIDNLKETGAVKLEGMVWTARSEHGDIIPAGTQITVKRMTGAKVWVEPVRETIEV